MAHKEKTDQPGKPSPEQKQAETIEELIRLIGVVKVSYGWMLTSMTHDKDEGMYSDDLKAAIKVQEALDLI